MKKHSIDSRLSLKRETLHTLDHTALVRAQGGGPLHDDPTTGNPTAGQSCTWGCSHGC